MTRHQPSYLASPCHTTQPPTVNKIERQLLAFDKRLNHPLTMAPPARTPSSCGCPSSGRRVSQHAGRPGAPQCRTNPLSLASQCISAPAPSAQYYHSLSWRCAGSTSSPAD
ncbi:hypothetical protein BKA56DRAFT_572235 [Ilyonectria sp. MPI-CAGE-AT-0026]|nr:hypothetical protein BKA56DRAFT_572235 [Ilyonectria sp. MPI-CAGE-AT-0026]